MKVVRWLALFALLAACAAEPPCGRHVRDEAWSAAIVSCRAAYAATGNAQDGYGLALGHLHLGHLDDAAAVARAARWGVHGADAWFVLGEVALARGDLLSATVHLSLALTQHAIGGDDPALARDAHGLAGVFWRGGRFEAALSVAALAGVAARRARSPRLIAFVELARADILRVTGDEEGAEAALNRALLATTKDSDRSWILLKRGLLYVDAGRDVLARASLGDVVRLERASPQPRVSIIGSAELNLSWLARRAGRLAEALTRVESAALMGAGAMDVHLNRGLALADAGRLTSAAAELAAAEAAGPRGEWSWWVPYRCGLVAEVAGRAADAEGAYGRAITAVARLRAQSGKLEPALIASHRQPYGALLELLARQARWREALGVVTALDADALGASIAAPRDLSPADGMARRAGGPQDEPPAVAVHDASAAVDALLSAWRGRSLTIVVPGAARMWRIEVEHGAVRGQDVGPVKALESGAVALEAHPEDATLAETLGGVVVAADRPSTAPVYALLVGPISRMPLAALRRHGEALQRSFALIRVLRIEPRAALPPPTASGVVMGDPLSNLAAARAEAEGVAQRLGGRLYLGAAADRAALRQSRGASRLHVAAHSELASGGAVLKLADGDVSVADITALRPGPRLVVLATCGAAALRDEVGWGSLAAAFLDAGADWVVASSGSLDDAAASRFVRTFYDQGGGADPARAVMATQALMARSGVPIRDWATFTVLAAPPDRAGPVQGRAVTGGPSPRAH